MLKNPRVGCKCNSPDDLAFCTASGTPRNQQNLYNCVLAPAYDRIKQRRISWHSFRHTQATAAHGSRRINQARTVPIGHSDLGRTLNIYAHVIPNSQRRAVERVAGVFFSDALELDNGRTEKSTSCEIRTYKSVGGPARI